MAESIPPKNLLVPAVLVFILFFGLMVFPPLGALIGVLAPFPLVFISLQRGRQVGIALVALVFVVLLLLVGANQAMLFLAEYALMALVLGELIRFQLPGDRCIAISALASGFVSMILLVVLFGEQDVSVKEFFEKQVRAHFSQSMEALESMGENKAEVAEMKAFAERAAEGFAASYPAFLLIGSLVGGRLITHWFELPGCGFMGRDCFRGEHSPSGFVQRTLFGVLYCQERLCSWGRAWWLMPG